MREGLAGHVIRRVPARLGRPRAGRFLGACAVLIALVAAGCADGGQPAGGASKTANEAVKESRLSQMPAYADAPWADEMKAEQDRLDALGGGDLYGGYSVPDFHGRYTNVEHGERRTLRLPCEGCPRRVVWFMGTSSAFGLGQRDDHTVASDLVRLGAADGVELVVRNLAVPGRTAYDERVGLEAHLATDPEPPDAVVFMDGFNDVLASYIWAILHQGALLDPIRFGDWVPDYLAITPPPTLPDRFQEPVATHVVEQYRANQAQIRSILDRRGIRSEFFFQADAFVSPVQMHGLAKSLNKPMADLSRHDDLGRLLARVTAGLSGDVHDLRPTFATFDQPVFADPAHLNETGARMEAAEIYRVLSGELS